MGYNPRVDPANKPLLESTTNLENWSAYTKQCWKRNCQSPCTHTSTWLAVSYACEPHQRRVARLAEQWKHGAAESIFSANAIFVESASAAALKASDRFGISAGRSTASFWRRCDLNGSFA